MGNDLCSMKENSKPKRYTTLDDYLPEIQEKFPEFSYEDIRYIIKHMSSRMYKFIRLKNDVLLFGNIDGKNVKFIFGRVVFKTISEKVRYVLRKFRYKMLYLWSRGKLKTDGYYYFGLTEEAYQNYLSQMNGWFKDEAKKRKRYAKHKFNYGNVTLYKVLDMCLVNKNLKHIFRIKFLSGRGLMMYKENYVIDGAEYYLKRTIDGFENMIVKYDKVNECEYIKY